MKITIETNPVPLARPRFSNNRAYLPKRSRDYRELIQAATVLQLPKDFSPCEDEIVCRLKFYHKYKRSARISGDIDNHIKAVFDALQGILFKDDSQIVSCRADKYTDKKNPRVEIEIKKAANDDCALTSTRNLRNSHIPAE